jgi:thiol-disulfide isomerase/thioredoxin
MENEINKLEALEELIANEPAVILYFYSDHCAPCKSLRPKIMELQENSFPLLKLAFINSDYRKLTGAFQIYDYPTLVIYFDRKEYIRVSKYVSVVQLEEHISRYYKMIFE